jgi:GxxExxY protein
MTLLELGGLTALTQKINGVAIGVHEKLGPGLFEEPYKFALAVDLREAGMEVRLEVPLTVHYAGKVLPCAYRMDMVVDETVVLEIKSIAKLSKVDRAQLVTYLHLSGYPVGLLLNFNAKLMKHGIMRVLNERVLNYREGLSTTNTDSEHEQEPKIDKK